jgi:hypothetical protein
MYSFKIVGVLYGLTDELTQFTRHVIQRAENMPSTLNPYHGMLPKHKYTIFKPTSLFNGNDINTGRLDALASEFGTTAEDLAKDTQTFFNHVPYKTPIGTTVRLVNKPDNTPFVSFLRGAIKIHPPDVMHSLRRGKHQLTSSSFFFTHWVSRFAIKPYFDVGLFIFIFVAQRIHYIYYYLGIISKHLRPCHQLDSCSDHGGHRERPPTA